MSDLTAIAWAGLVWTVVIGIAWWIATDAAPLISYWYQKWLWKPMQRAVKRSW